MSFFLCVPYVPFCGYFFLCVFVALVADGLEARADTCGR
jgi:hypothetical protein